jgi:hypothetical protein
MPLKSLICRLYELIRQTFLSDQDYRVEVMRERPQVHFLKAFQFFHIFFLFLDKRVKQPGIYINASIIKTLDPQAASNKNGSLF